MANETRPRPARFCRFSPAIGDPATGGVDGCRRDGGKVNYPSHRVVYHRPRGVLAPSRGASKVLPFATSGYGSTLTTPADSERWSC